MKAVFAVMMLAAGCGGSPDGARDGGREGEADARVADRDAGTRPQPTRLRVTSQCDAPIWIAHSDNVTDAQNVRLAKGDFHDYAIPAAGLSATRFWPKQGCDATGHACKIGDNGEGGGRPCGPTGCQPPVDSKFEATFAAVGGGLETFYNLSQVDGYTLPFAVFPKGPGAGLGTCTVSDCSALSLDRCPGNEDLSGGGGFPQYASLDLRVRDPDDPNKTIACLAPCKKWNYPAPYGLARPESEDPGLHMCCPTPTADPAACTLANHCMTPEACRAEADPLSVVHTSYVEAVHAMCPTAYSYSYDDAAGLHACRADTSFEVVFCP